MTTKLEKIRNIKRIINTYGGFHISELDGEGSPVIKTMGKDHTLLAEEFNEQVTAITYVHEVETNEDYIDYEDLSDDLIDQINVIAEDYEAEQLLTEKRIS